MMRIPGPIYTKSRPHQLKCPNFTPKHKAGSSPPLNYQPKFSYFIINIITSLIFSKSTKLVMNLCKKMKPRKNRLTASISIL